MPSARQYSKNASWSDGSGAGTAVGISYVLAFSSHRAHLPSTQPNPMPIVLDLQQCCWSYLRHRGDAVGIGVGTVGVGVGVGAVGVVVVEVQDAGVEVQLG